MAIQQDIAVDYISHNSTGIFLPGVHFWNSVLIILD